MSATALSVALAVTAHARVSVSDVRMCSTQTEDLAEHRIIACTAMLNAIAFRANRPPLPTRFKDT